MPKSAPVVAGQSSDLGCGQFMVLIKLIGLASGESVMKCNRDPVGRSDQSVFMLQPGFYALVKAWVDASQTTQTTPDDPKLASFCKRPE